MNEETAFAECSSRDKLESYVDRFESLARQKFDKPVADRFYEPHWFLFCIPWRPFETRKLLPNFTMG